MTGAETARRFVEALDLSLSRHINSCYLGCGDYGCLTLAPSDSLLNYLYTVREREIWAMWGEVMGCYETRAASDQHLWNDSTHRRSEVWRVYPSTHTHQKTALTLTALSSHGFMENVMRDSRQIYSARSKVRVSHMLFESKNTKHHYWI